MKDPRDRRDLGYLGLTVLVYGLVVAPLLHAVVDHAGELKLPAAARGWLSHGEPSEQEHGHSHEHGREVAEGSEHEHGTPGHGHEHGPTDGHEESSGHKHQWGAVEHLGAVAVESPVALAPVADWVALRAEVLGEPLRLPGRPVRLTAMPQGP